MLISHETVSSCKFADLSVRYLTLPFFLKKQRNNCALKLNLQLYPKIPIFFISNRSLKTFCTRRSILITRLRTLPWVVLLTENSQKEKVSVPTAYLGELNSKPSPYPHVSHCMSTPGHETNPSHTRHLISPFNCYNPKLRHPYSLYSSTTPLLAVSTMAERLGSPGQTQQRPPRTTTTTTASTTSSFLRKLHENAPNPTQLLGIFTLVISGGILLLLTGFTLTATVLGFIFFTPLVIISSPIWFPVGSILFLFTVGFLSFCGFGVAIVAAISWLYRYFRGFHPPGSDRVDYARSRIADTASHVKDYAREYGGYLHSKVKDAAPGA